MLPANRVIGLVLAIAWLSVAAPGPRAAAEDRLHQTDRPNIILLLTDDQATSTLGCYGNADVTTPHLDRMAQTSLVFDRHYVSTAICMASRASIFTGLYEYRHGCNFGLGKLSPQHWAQSYPVLLRRAGYRTAFAGKFGMEIEGMTELPRGDFDRWGGGPGQTFYETARNPSMAAYAERYPHSTLAYGAFGCDFIRESVDAGQPFCLSISFKAPHRPVKPDPGFDDVYRDRHFHKPANFGREHGRHLAPQSRTGRQYPRFEQWGYADDYDRTMQQYNQLVYAVDQAVDMILDEIERQGISENTIVIFTSDNGYLCGAHGFGSKVLPYEESSRVPLIIHAPQFPRSQGQRTDSLSGNIDLPATILDLAGIGSEAWPEMDGVSLRPVLESPETVVRDRLALMNFWGPATTHSLAVVTPDWKYVYWYSQEDGMPATEELFDLRGSRLENRNAAQDGSHQDVLRQMRTLYDDQVEDIGRNAINVAYRRYATLFDRSIPWDAKSELLRRAAGK